MWDHIPIEELIRRTGFGLAPDRWREQLKEIRQLPEPPEPEDKAA